MPPRQKKPEVETQLVVTPGRWVKAGRPDPGPDGQQPYRWEEGTHQDLDDRHEYPHRVPREATNLTTEFGTYEFVGLPDLPEGGYEGHQETADDLQEQIAALTVRRDALRAKQ